MQRSLSIGIITAALSLAVSPPALAQTRQDDVRFQQAQQRFDSELATFRAEFDRYQQARSRGWQGGGGQGYDDRDGRDSDDRYEGGYDPARYYREAPTYRERTLSSDDRVYRGNDGRYYCKRSDGTTGLILGAAGGGILGNVIDGGHSRTAGTLIGGALGALAGKSIEQNNDQLRCR